VGWPDRDGRPTKEPALAPGVECWHTANGGERRDAFEGKRLKESGVRAGIQDLLYLRPTTFSDGSVWGLLFGQEWKKPDAKRVPLARRSPHHLALRSQLVVNGQAPERLVDMLSDAQLEMHPRLMRAGMAATIVVDNLKDAREWCYAMGLTARLCL
jgi:hypothetical protein